MASTDPTEDAIALFCEITGRTIDRHEAIMRLKGNNNDISRATDEYLEDPDSAKYKWDDSAFRKDREGITNDAGIAFNIQGPDETAPLSTAPTRPPSRTANNRSPLGAPTNRSQEDADLQRALAESAADVGLPPQETGVVDAQTDQTYFGPANRPQYDSAEWAMVPASGPATKTDLEPSKRKRGPEAPAFLVQTKDHRVGALLSIYHKIPLARNILLRCGTPTRNYGFNSRWWRGEPILKQEHLQALHRGEHVWGDDMHPDFSEELHRIMAFLDNTERSFGTVDNLVETSAVDPSHGAYFPDVEENLYLALRQASIENPDCDVEPMTTEGKLLPVAPDTSNPSESFEEDSEPRDVGETSFMFLDIRLDSNQYATVNTLYDALDQLLWADTFQLDRSFPDSARFAVLTKPAEIVTIRIGVSGLSKPCEIPAIFYADRYTMARQDTARHFQLQIRKLKEGLRKLQLWEEARVRCKGDSGCSRMQGLGQTHDARECHGKAITISEQLMKDRIKDAQWRSFKKQTCGEEPFSMDDLQLIYTGQGPFQLTGEEQDEMYRLESIVKAAKDKIEEVDRDLVDCKRKKELYEGCLEIISKRLTCKEDEVDDELFVFKSNPEAYHPEFWNPTQKYHLRGVALTRELAYVCVRGQADLIELEGEASPRDQWWKIEYVADHASPVRTEKVSLDEAVNAAGTGSKFPILVYATEAALDVEPIALPDVLRMFAKQDNRAFQAELSQEQNQEAQAEHVELPAGEKQIPSGPVTAEHLRYLQDETPHSIEAGWSVSPASSVGAVILGDDNECPQLDFEGSISDRTPEMQERSGGSRPLFGGATHGSSSGRDGPIDLMDLETDEVQ
ncbi:hypothetical protein F4780DRAFT_728709 [Xylariomycetidae sp. FL0641]|nr:hypothetical protein F4780DRAFT_728709 [Xylariomycetidae sp. FL0641]